MVNYTITHFIYYILKQLKSLILKIFIEFFLLMTLLICLTQKQIVSGASEIFSSPAPLDLSHWCQTMNYAYWAIGCPWSL